jgi:hypothetical protein
MPTKQSARGVFLIMGDVLLLLAYRQSSSKLDHLSHDSHSPTTDETFVVKIGRRCSKKQNDDTIQFPCKTAENVAILQEPHIGTAIASITIVIATY